MNVELRNKKGIRYLTAYYGVLQLSHLVILGRTLVIYLQTDILPFPASPPAQGWSPQVIPFFFGMGAVDAVAAVMGISFAGLFLFMDRIRVTLGLVSLIIAMTSALIFAVGTIANGAWSAHTGEYLSMVVVFLPLIPLLFSLLRSISQRRSTR